MTKITLLLLTLINLSAFGQDNSTILAKPNVDEGKRLYKSEMASWYGTDLFLESYKDRANIGGYFSYSEHETTKCVFFSKSDKPTVIGTIFFDSTYDTKTAKIDLTERGFTKIENDLFAIKRIAVTIISSDTLFKTYRNTNLNLIPLISNGERKVYVLTGPEQSGVAIFGNDYLLTFDADNNLLSQKQLHKNIIAINYGDKVGEGQKVETTIHTHLPETGDFITATDICTLMLYEKFAKWKQHNVVSKNYLNIWNCETDQLVVIPMKTIDKINKDQEKRNKKKNTAE
jgi:hypothetical protein